MTSDPPSGRVENLTLRPIGVIHTDPRAPVPTPGPPLTPDELRAKTAASPAGHEGVDMYDGTPLLDIKPYEEHGA